MALLQPWQTTLDALYAEAASSAEARGLAQALGGQRLDDTPHLIMSIGANKKHVYQGNIWMCSPKHPLLFRALLDTSEARLARQYLRLCEFLWVELKRDLGDVPKPGWNYCKSYGPVYLFQEKSTKRREVSTSSGIRVPMDGHMQFLADGKTTYAATRAWGWMHGFLQTALVASAVQQTMGTIPEVGPEDAVQAGVASSSASCEVSRGGGGGIGHECDAGGLGRLSCGGEESFALR